MREWPELRGGESRAAALQALWRVYRDKGGLPTGLHAPCCVYREKKETSQFHVHVATRGPPTVPFTDTPPKKSSAPQGPP